MAPAQHYVDYTLLSNSSHLFGSSSFSNSTAIDKWKEIEEILCKRRRYLIGMMILFSFNFVLTTIQLFVRIHDNREQKMRRDGAAAILDLQEKIRSDLKENSFHGLHLGIIERIVWDGSKKE